MNMLRVLLLAVFLYRIPKISVALAGCPDIICIMYYNTLRNFLIFA